MAIAIVPLIELHLFATEIGFPYDHRLNLTKGAVGYKLFDEFIRTNVQWIQELAFDKERHIKLWSSSSITGDVPKAHEYHSRSVMIGTESVNPFNEEGSVCHPNFIGSTFRISCDFIADYKMTAEDTIDVQEYIRVIVSEKATDSYLGYGLEIPVEKLWNKHYKTDGENRFWLERSERRPENEYFDDVEYFYVRELTEAEAKEFFEYNEVTAKWVLKRHKDGTTVADVEFKSAEAIDLNNFSGDEETYIANHHGLMDNINPIKAMAAKAFPLA